MPNGVAHFVMCCHVAEFTRQVTDPSILIADEPVGPKLLPTWKKIAEYSPQTSGLDANTAKSVMEALKDLAQSGYADYGY